MTRRPPPRRARKRPAPTHAARIHDAIEALDDDRDPPHNEPRPTSGQKEAPKQ